MSCTRITTTGETAFGVTGLHSSCDSDGLRALWLGLAIVNRPPPSVHS